MTKRVCPKCSIQAYDATSFFCHKCGTQLLAYIPETKNSGDPNSEMDIPKKESMIARYDSLSRKPGSIPRIKPIEICARCGSPIIDKNRIFCTTCSPYVRDIVSGDESTVIQHPISRYPDTKTVSTPEIYQPREGKTILEQEPGLIQGIPVPIHLKAPKWKLLIILAGLAIFFLMLILIVMLMLNFWVSLT